MPDDARTSNLLHFSHGVGNHPMTADELHRIRSLICNADGVKKEPLIETWIGAAGIIFGFDVDPDVSRGGFGGRHSIGEWRAFAVQGLIPTALVRMR